MTRVNPGLDTREVARRGLLRYSRAPVFIYLYFILFALAFPTKGRADPSRARSPPFAILSSTNSNNANWHVTPLSQQRQTYHARGSRKLRSERSFGDLKDTSFLSLRRGSITDRSGFWREIDAEANSNPSIQYSLLSEQRKGLSQPNSKKQAVPIGGFRNDVCSVIANGCISDPHSLFDTCRPCVATPRAFDALIWRLLYNVKSSRLGGGYASITRNNIFL